MTTDGSTALRSGAALVEGRAAGVVVVTGADARSFLQNLVSQNVEALADGEGAPSLLLQPTGKVDVVFRALVVGDHWWLDCEAGYGERLASTLSRFRIRVDVEIDDHSEAWGRLSVKGPDAVVAVSGALGIEVPAQQYAHVAWSDARVVRADWPGVPGVDVVGPLDAVDRAAETLTAAGLPVANETDVEAVRIEAGVPRQGFDVDDKTIPQEALLERTTVDFDKGCFIGQELVCRIRDRGRVTRLLRRLRVAAADGGRPERGAVVTVDDAEVGQVTSVVDAPEAGVVALGYVRTTVEPGVEVTLRWDGGQAKAVVEETAGA